MNRTHTTIASIIAIMNLISALLILNFGGSLTLGYINLIAACVLATWVAIKGQ